MSRSKIKYTPLYTHDLRTYFYSLLNVYKNIKPLKYSRETFNGWNTLNTYYVHQGKSNVTIKLSKFHLDYKVGIFRKTRKPSFFRTKK